MSDAANEERFEESARAVRENPGDAQSWDLLDEIAAESQRPEEVAALYREALQGELSGSTATSLSERAVAFHEEWFREDSPLLVEVLSQVLDVDPTASDWAFERLTVVYTVGEKWDDLLKLYDREIQNTADTIRKANLLEEAAQTARDFASKPDVAIDYMLQLVPLRRGDKQLHSSLERLLDKQGRYQDLVSLWRSRVADESASTGRELKLRIAQTLFEKLERPGDSIAELRDLLADPEADSAGPLEMLEKVAADESVEDESRHEAITLLREKYASENRTTAVIQTLDTALALADSAEQIALHRDAARRLEESGELTEAMEHWGSVLRLSPKDSEALDCLREVSVEAADPKRLVDLLLVAADAGEGPADRAHLRWEAAESLARVGETENAIAQLEILARSEGVEPPIALSAAQLLSAQLEQTDRRAELASALERRAELEKSAPKRRDALGRAASLYAELESLDEALRVWEVRLSDDPRDGEALSTIIRLLEENERWDALVRALRRRVDSGVTDWQKRSDMVRIAGLQSGPLDIPNDAIATWNEVAAIFGENAEVAASLTDLYERTERFEDMASVLERSGEREDLHLSEIRARLGAVLSEKLGRSDDAIRSFRSALIANPGNEGARAGLALMCDEPSVASEALDILAGAFERCDEWEPTLALLEQRLAATPPGPKHAAFLADAAKMQEELAESPAAALRSLCRAFPFAPANHGIERDLLRLFDSSEEDDIWQQVADAFGGAGRESDDPVRRAHLFGTEADLRKDRDLEGALLAAQNAFEARPLQESTGDRLLHSSLASESYERAEELLKESLSNELAPLSHLARLASVQRASGSPDLAETLARISDARPTELDALKEGAEIALSASEDRMSAKARELLELLYGRASAMWRRGANATGQVSADQATRWAAEQLTNGYDELEETERSSRLYESLATLPLPAAEAAEFRWQAAQRAREDRPSDAIRLLQDVVVTRTDDLDAAKLLADLLEVQGRQGELLDARKRELSLTSDAERRVELRMRIANIVTKVELEGGRDEVLAQNLEEHPGHEATLRELERILVDRSKHAQLQETLVDQASKVEGERGIELLQRAAHVALDPMHDTDRAISAYRKIVEIDAQNKSALRSLADIHRQRDEASATARWLEKLLVALGEPAERATLSLELAQTLVDAGRDERASEVLESALEEAPAHSELREMLSERYRDAGNLEGLATVFAAGAEHTSDEETVMRYVRDAARIYRDELDRPDDAIPVLRRGMELAPSDHEIKLQLGQGLFRQGELDEARSVLEASVEDFGRRRSPARAMVHYQLGLVARAQGDLDAALGQLEQASKMGKAQPRILEMLGRLAKEAGHLERAEKAYRTLLMTVRRNTGEEVDVSAGEVLYELHTIAERRGDSGKAEELLESALEAASQNDAEALRFRDGLIEREAPELAIRGLERRANATDSESSRGTMLVAIGAVLSSEERFDEAFEHQLNALRVHPASPETQTAAIQGARAAGKTGEIVTALEELVQKHKRHEEAELQGALLVRLGEVNEEDLGNLDAAMELYGRAEVTLERPIAAWQALARVGAARNDLSVQKRVLGNLLSDDALASGARASALHQYADVLLRSGQLDEGADIARKAFDADPRHGHLIEALDIATASDPNHSAAMSLYEEVARDSGMDPLLLPYLERRAQRDDATIGNVREAAEKAQELELHDRVEPLLERAVVLSEANDDRDNLRWALGGLADARMAAGDAEVALQWMERALQTADDENERREMELRLASLAGERPEQYAIATRIYERLLEQDPLDPEVWEPLLGIYLAQRSLDQLESLSAELVSSLLDPSARNKARMMLAKGRMLDAERQYEAVEILKDVLMDEPDHTEAADLLAQLYEASGYDEELVDLLETQLNVARDNQDIENIVSLSLRLGALFGQVRRDDALDVYRRALDWSERDRGIVLAYLDLLGPEDELSEIADLRERLLHSEEGESAGRLARQLMTDRNALEDGAGYLRALALGFERNPSDAPLREQLEEHYRGHELWEELSGFLLIDAKRVAEQPDAMVAKIREAAQIQRERLNNPNGAVELLREARMSSGSIELMHELVDALAGAGDIEGASHEVSEELNRCETQDDVYAHLLDMRARLSLAQNNVDAAIEDLETAYPIAPSIVSDDLADALGRRADALRHSDRDACRVATLRRIEVFEKAGKREEARDLLAAWVQEEPGDIESLTRLRDVDQAAENWEGVVDASARLAGLLEGDARVDAALLVADTARRIGDPARGKGTLEDVFAALPEDTRVRARLRELYEEIAAHRDLAQLLAHEASLAEPEAAFELYRKAGSILVDELGDGTAALPMLQKAVEAKPDDHQTTVLLVDAYLAAQRFPDAGQLLEQAIAQHTRRRSPELSELQHRMARLANAAGDPMLEMQWLNAALEADKNNSFVAAELAQLARQVGDLDTALAALRAVTLSKKPGPMSRAQAFLMQAEIAHQKGEARRALLWARKAKTEDPELAAVDDFLRAIGEG